MDQIADFFNEVDTQLELPLERRIEVMRELLLHYRETTDSLRADGVEECEAQQEALSRLGSPREIAASINAVQNSASAKSALISAVPFFGWAICLIMPTQFARLICGVLLGAVLVIGCIREFIKRRRPVWLATWLAANYVGIAHIIGDGVLSLFFCGTSLAVAILVLWNSEWRRCAIGCVLIMVPCIAIGRHIPMTPTILKTTFSILSAISVLFGTCVLPYLVAMRLFTECRQGGAWKTSLCIFTVCVFVAAWTKLSVPTWQIAMSFIIAGLAVMIFVQASRWSHKAVALTIGLLIKLALFDAVVNRGHFDSGKPDFELGQYLTGLFFFWALLALLSIAPMLSERADWEARRAAART